MYRKKTLRQMQPTTRKVARLLNELDSVHHRLANLLEEIAEMEADSTALQNMNRAREEDR
jgi:hypothetical protein